MPIINEAQYPRYSRLLIAWMIKCEMPATAHGIAWPPMAKEYRWEENDQIAEVTVAEYSPSGKMVRLVSPGGENFMHSPTNGWYPVERIIVKEALPPSLNQAPGIW